MAAGHIQHVRNVGAMHAAKYMSLDLTNYPPLPSCAQSPVVQALLRVEGFIENYTKCKTLYGDSRQQPRSCALEGAGQSLVVQALVGNHALRALDATAHAENVHDLVGPYTTRRALFHAAVAAGQNCHVHKATGSHLRSLAAY